MASLKEVRSRITSVQSTQQITKAMKMVAAAKLRRAQDNILRMRPYAQRLNSILGNLTALAGEEVVSEYSVVRDVRRVLIIAITSDRGLAGAFNSNIFKGVNAVLQERYATQAAAGNVTVLAIGRKAHEYFGKRLPLLGNYQHVFGKLSFDTVREAAEQAMDGFRAGQYDEVVMVYNEFKNVATQIVRTEQLLPLVPAEQPVGASALANADYIFEPSKEEIVRTLIPQSLKVQLYKAVLESNASEHGARMTAMDKATDNAGELLKQLKLTYNRTRQAAITTEILEIVGGAEALAAGR
ncbi:F-type H+-transporting ATPase subunit gamma [Hymenobacter luteus]|uniref:ATP synthase gamma chain n=2 Tax=Hymenobacter TaxID=89966 RepID=A0A7W9T2H0_9BACT|nr:MULTISPECIES: ATP synthase F1 subunit gamma [Hymenobacter]MBB4602389.1 F-type H+-transporting ATPase subunit gamma [Hymenobacter latericoloratus]MBB6060280.1 F-type H+-transporting ATPase subunit gamma [Hymenobacter luteus]